MFYYINGTVTVMDANLAVIDCGGVGYACNTTGYTLSQLQIGKQHKLFTYCNVKEDAFVMTLEIAGKMFDSVEFSQKIEKLGVQGTSHIQFIIGGSRGLHESICKRSDLAVSFSKMTFPHQLMRVVLLEQIYRGYRIMNGEPYHK